MVGWGAGKDTRSAGNKQTDAGGRNISKPMEGTGGTVRSFRPRKAARDEIHDVRRIPRERPHRGYRRQWPGEDGGAKVEGQLKTGSRRAPRGNKDNFKGFRENQMIYSNSMGGPVNMGSMETLGRNRGKGKE